VERIGRWIATRQDGDESEMVSIEQERHIQKERISTERQQQLRRSRMERVEERPGTGGDSYLEILR